MLKPIPKLRGSNAVEALLNFYQDLGWNRKETLGPTRAIMNEDDWLELIEQLVQIEGNDNRFDIGVLMINRGPSGNRNIIKGKVEWKSD